MALRQGCNNDEIRKLIEAYKSEKDWDKAKKAVPGVDPKVLDEGFKSYVIAQVDGKKPEPKPEPKAKPDPLK